MQRVRGDESGDGDEAPDTLTIDERCVMEMLEKADEAALRVGL